jgi:hypothetical protein
MADLIRLTLPAKASFADVAAETAATAALRLGFAGAEVDRLRHDVAEAFGDSTGEPSSSDAVLVELIVDTTEIVVRIGGDHGRNIHLGRRQDAATFDG